VCVWRRGCETLPLQSENVDTRNDEPKIQIIVQIYITGHESEIQISGVNKFILQADFTVLQFLRR